MNIEGCIALVTGAGRGLGKAYVESLIRSGAAKVYAGARDPTGVRIAQACPIALDVTSRDEVASAATQCSDVNLLINCAGVMTLSTSLDPDAGTHLRQEMDVNVYGLMSMIGAFAPILKENGGGVIVNVLSLASVVPTPMTATYSASKHAAQAITDTVRIQLRSQGTTVVGVYSAFVDTEMTSGIEAPKIAPDVVAYRTLEGVRVGTENVLADKRSEYIFRTMYLRRAEVLTRIQVAWDAKNGNMESLQR